ncbi:MAG: glycosyltransferase family 4 protein [Chloroflexi bacterium]|nr:glycosyltransferase family 4 protein [Chloroflexota bacterium]MCC6894973.1 glycosyltransferase family 4 protein [Anaerolineae bacterium]
MSQTQRPIKIMNLIARLNVGGPAVAVTHLTEQLGAPDYESLLVCGTIEPGEGDMSYYAIERGITPIIIPELGRSLSPIRDIRTLWKVYQLIRQEKPDVIHTHAAKAGFVGRVAAWLAGVPVIVHTFHGHVFRGYFSPTKTQFFIVLERLTARMSDTVITLSDGLRRELAEEYHITRKGRITVLPLGLDLKYLTEMPRKTGDFRKAYNIPFDAPLVGIVGRITPIKNHPLFLQAALKIREQLPNARFAIVGDGETRAETEALVDQLGLREAVIFTGWQKDMGKVYSDLDVLVISSVNEGTPVTVIEALAAGCPVVATAVGGLPDLLDHGKLGKLVEQDATALCSGIVDTLNSPPDGHEAQTLMVDRYGIERLVKDLDGLYRGILAKKHRSKTPP